MTVPFGETPLSGSPSQATGVSPVQELSLPEIDHLHQAFYAGPRGGAAGGQQLDYHALGGPGLERLCFHLLLARGHAPRFFGKPGQAQYGIDLIASDGKQCTVYQCKNLASFEEPELRKALEKFEQEWLGRTYLPKPQRFVLCCPLDLRERTANESWQRLVEGLRSRHEVAVEIWHREILDTFLRRQPDIVADLFSQRVAEWFCGLDDWNQGLFRPLKPGSGERRAVERYLPLKAGGKIVRDSEMAGRFAQILAAHELVLVLGAPGSGKTITTLDLAESLDGGAWRVFFVSFRYQTSEDNLVAGI